MMRRFRGWAGKLGPGLITGAADDDPQRHRDLLAGRRAVRLQLRLDACVLTYPLMVGIQMVSARIGRVTGHGLAANIREPLSAAGALRDRRAAGRRQHDQHRRRHRGDGRGAAARRRRAAARVTRLSSASVCLLLQVFLPYQRYVRFLKWLTLALLAYVGRRVHGARALGRGAAGHACGRTSR